MSHYCGFGAIAAIFVLGSAGLAFGEEKEEWKGTTETQGAPTTVEKKGTTATITISHGQGKPPVVLTAPLTNSQEIKDQATLKWYDTSYEKKATWPARPEHSGYVKVFEVINKGTCKEWNFIQLRSFRAVWKPSNEQAFPPPGPKDREVEYWDVDGPTTAKDPHFGKLSGLPQGETATLDIPGAFKGKPGNADWGTPGHISHHLKTIFRLWIECADPKAYYGYLEWGFEIDRDAPKGETYSGLKTNPPKWHDAKDEADEQARLERMVERYSK